MKQIFYLCLALVLSTNLSAQLQQLQKKASSIDLTGGLSVGDFYYGTVDYRYMLSDRLMVGLGFDGLVFPSLSSSFTNEFNKKFSIFSFNPSIRYFLSPKDKQMQWFVEGRVGWGNSRESDIMSNGQKVFQDLSTNQFQIGGGVSRFIAPGLMLEGQLGYRFRSPSVGGHRDKESLFLELRLRPFFNGSDVKGPIETEGKWLVDGYFKWNHALNPYSEKGVDLKLEALRFVSPRIALGGTVAYSSQNATLNGKVQGRYYLNPRQRLQLFLKAELGPELETGSISVLALDGSVGFGINYYLNKRLALEFTTGFDFGYGGYRGTTLSGQLGLKYLIGK